MADKEFSRKEVNVSGDSGIGIGGDVFGSILDQSKHTHFHIESLEIFNPSKFKPKRPPKENKNQKRGNLPPGSRLLFPINYTFTGRDQDLLDIAGHFFYSEEKDDDNKQVILSSGIGGIGKTQLAVEFCYRYGCFFHGVHWLQADQDIPSQIAGCGSRMGLLPWPEEQPQQVDITLKAWQDRKPRLVVFDNLESLDVLQEWPPRLSGIHILATSRRSRWPAHLGIINLPTKELSIEDS